jgi:hypothetical protein
MTDETWARRSLYVPSPRDPTPENRCQQNTAARSHAHSLCSQHSRQINRTRSTIADTVRAYAARNKPLSAAMAAAGAPI